MPGPETTTDNHSAASGRPLGHHTVHGTDAIELRRLVEFVGVPFGEVLLDVIDAARLGPHQYATAGAVTSRPLGPHHAAPGGRRGARRSLHRGAAHARHASSGNPAGWHYRLAPSMP